MSGLTLSHARDARWDEGLRAFFAYRDLEMLELTLPAGFATTVDG